MIAALSALLLGAWITGSLLQPDLTD